MASQIRTYLLFQPPHGLENAEVGWNVGAWQPNVDVYGHDGALLILVEAPGLRLDELQLHFEPGLLMVEGRREAPKLPRHARANLVEMHYGPFRRQIQLPPDCDGDGIRATYDAGILQIEVPRTMPTPPKNVRVEIS